MRDIAQRSLRHLHGGPSIAICECVAPLSDGEVHALHWFVRGNIMTPYTWRRLWRAWGLCQRHACGFISIDAAFRNHGLAILYAELMQRAQGVMQLHEPLWRWRLAWRLRDREPCLMCGAGLGPHSHSAAAADILARSRDVTAIRAFAARTSPFWRNTVCGRCLGVAADPRCRPHLLEDIRDGVTIDLPRQQALVTDISRRTGVHARAFRWDAPGGDTIADQAALISAVGWCSGWKALLQLVEDNTAMADAAGEANRTPPHRREDDQ